jgi:peptide/nickel transport system permease protein
MMQFGSVIVVAIALSALLAPWIVPYDPSVQDLPLRLEGPSGSHVFGLDELGRDILSRVLMGARVSLMVGFIVVGVSSLLGSAVGSIAG